MILDERYIVFDLDGTLADISHRLHYIQNGNKNWKAFFQACSDDAPIHWTINLSRRLYKTGDDIIILTGRSDEVRAETDDWLKYNGIQYKKLLMRKSGDHRPDVIVKPELLDHTLAIDFIFEDRTSMVDEWRRRGFNVLQCVKGDY